MTTTTKQTTYTKDVENKKLTVVREFDAPVKQVWRAWTETELLEQWWAPKPWQAKTQSMDFKVGGQWLYYMLGPDGTRHWCALNYTGIDPQKSFTGEDAFCDEKGNLNTDIPVMHWECKFSSTASGTKVVVVVSFNSMEDMEKIIEMGFKEGFAAAHGNLDELLASLN